MKKIILLIVPLILIFIIVYIAIPSQILISNSVGAHVNISGITRNISEENNWKQWWPGTVKDSENKMNFLLDSYQFKLNKVLYNALEININKGEKTDSSLLQFFAIQNDSIRMVWSTKISTGNNPFSKINAYFKSREIKSKMTAILNAIQQNARNLKNIYGVSIETETRPEQFLVSTKKEFSSIPSTQDIYKIINDIRTYIINTKGEVDSFPMVNILTLDSTHFVAQVAVPIKNPIPGNATFSIKNMPNYAKFLVAEIKGGKGSIEFAQKSFKFFIADYQKTVMASPFQLLVTDRSKQTDSSKWITRIFYPIM